MIQSAAPVFTAVNIYMFPQVMLSSETFFTLNTRILLNSSTCLFVSIQTHFPCKPFVHSLYTNVVLASHLVYAQSYHYYQLQSSPQMKFRLHTKHIAQSIPNSY